MPNGPFAINVWTNELASKVLRMDVQRDKLSYGKLPVISHSSFFLPSMYCHLFHQDLNLFFIIFFQLKPQYGQDYCLFGGLQGLDKFMRVHAPQNCSEQVFLIFFVRLGIFVFLFLVNIVIKTW